MQGRWSGAHLYSCPQGKPYIQPWFPENLTPRVVPPFVAVQLLSCVCFFATLWTVACQVPLSSTISQSLLRFRTIASVMVSNHLILCGLLLLLPSVFPSIRVFSNRLACRIRWPKYWNFSSSPSNKHSELISFKIDWFDLLAIQGTLKCLTQHHDLKASILQHSAFFTVQLSHSYLCVRVCVCVCVCVCVLVAQLCLTLCNPTDYSPPGFSVHGILQARILEWIAIPFSKRTSHLRDQTLVSLITGRFFTVWATGKSVSITDY